MKIYKNDTEFIDIDVTDSSYRYRAIRGDNALTLYFSSPTHVEIPVGSWTEFQSQRYELTQPENFKKHSTRNFEYTLVMEGEQTRLKRYKFRDSTSGRLKFSYTAKPQEHLKMLVDNLNSREFSENASENLLWKVGDSVDSADKVISYNHTSCWDALNQMADTFETEWEVDGRTIHLRKVEYNKDTEQEKSLALSYGKGNGFKSGVGRSNADNSNPVEVLFVQGGNKNIDSSTYGNSVLLLPQEQQLEYEGRTYVVDKDGLSIRRADTELKTGMEDSLDCGHIYPHREGAVSKVEPIEKGDLYDFIDESIPESLDYNKYLLEGESITVIFQEGMLVGKEFEVNYVHPERRFKIVPQDFDGQQMPNKNFKPEVGQKYAVFGIGMPESYLRDDETQSGASWDMFREAAKYLYENEEPRFSFTGELDGLWSKSDWTNIGGKIKLGGYVFFSDNQFQPEGIQIRIVGIKDFVNNPYSPTIELSNVTVGGTVSSQLKKVDSNEVVVEELHRDALQFTKRRYRDVQETMKMLEEAQLNFSNSIQPLTVETMQAIVGDESLQFRFIQSREEPIPVTHEVRYDKDKRKLMADAGVLQHMTLGIDAIRPTPDVGMYKSWELPEYESAVLDKPENTFYLYAKVSKNGGDGEFRLEEKSQAMDGGDSYYLLMGILNSEYEGERSFVSLYGYTEILPGRITTDRIVSTDGSTYFDLVKNEIGGNLKFYAKNGSLVSVNQGIEDAVDEVHIGGENLVENGQIDEESSLYGFATRTVNVEAMRTYVLSVEAKINQTAAGKEKVGRVYLHSADWARFWFIEFIETDFVTKTLDITPEISETLYITSYLYPNGGDRDGKFYVQSYMLQRGSKATAYQNAVKYLTSAIQNGSTEIIGGLSLMNQLFMKDIDGNMRAGMSGVETDNIGAWFGGTYTDALANLANAIIKKDGSGYFAKGLFNWNTVGGLNVGVFSVLDDRIVVRGDSGNIIITNKTIQDVASESNTIRDVAKGEIECTTRNSPISLHDYTFCSINQVVPVKSTYKLHIDIDLKAIVDIRLPGAGQGYGNIRNEAYLEIESGGNLLRREYLGYFDLEVEIEDDETGSSDSKSSNIVKNFDYVDVFDTNLVVRVTLTNGQMIVNAPVSSVSDAVISGGIIIEGISTTKETIVASDGFLVRQDSANEFKIMRDNNQIRISAQGLSRDANGLEKGNFWIDNNGNLKVVT